MELVLNPYVKNVTEKFLTPLLRENGSEKLQPQLNSWHFNPAKIPHTGDWDKLINYKVEDIQKSKEISTLPINAKLRLNEGMIYLEIFMKFIKLKLDIGDEEIDDTNNHYNIHDMPTYDKYDKYDKEDMPEYDKYDKHENNDKVVMIHAATTPTEEDYYHCKLDIGPSTRQALTNRAKNITLQLGVNIQDLRFHMDNRVLKLFRHQSGKLMYIHEEQYDSNVKRIAKANKEVKLHGQEENHKNKKYIDPRKVKIIETIPLSCIIPVNKELVKN